MFWKKDPAKELEKDYAKKMTEYRNWLEQGNRAKADLAYAEADAIMSRLVELKKMQEPKR